MQPSSMPPPREVQPNNIAINLPQQKQEKPVINGFTVTSNTSAEKIIDGFKVTINFPEGSIDRKSFDDYLAKFDEKPLRQMVGLIANLNSLSTNPEKPRSYAIKDYGTDKVGIMKSSGDKSKDISNPEEYYRAKLGDETRDSSVIQRKINLIKDIRVVSQNQFKPINNPINDQREVAQHKSLSPPVGLIRTNSGEAKVGKEVQKPTVKSEINRSQEVGNANLGAVAKQVDKQKISNKPMTQLEKREALARKMEQKDAAIVEKYKHLGLFRLKPAENKVLSIQVGNVNAPKNVVPCEISKEESAFAHEISNNEGSRHFTSDSYSYYRDDILPFLEFNQYEDKYAKVDFEYFSAKHGSVLDSVDGQRKSVEITPDNIAEKIKYDTSKDIAIPIHLNKNHWGLVYIDHEKKTVEFYDSMANNQGYPNIDKNIKEIAKKFGGYEVKYKVTKQLQFNGHDCGPWTMYFLQNRLENKNVDFNLLDRNKVGPMITNYRRHIVKSRLIKEFRGVEGRVK